MTDRHGVRHQLAPPEKGNQRALKHGAYSLTELEPQAQTVERFIWSTMPWLQESDALLVRKASLALVREARAQAELDAKGLTDRRAQLRPLVKVIRSFSAEARRHLEQLGGTPARRAELGVAVSAVGASAQDGRHLIPDDPEWHGQVADILRSAGAGPPDLEENR